MTASSQWGLTSILRKSLSIQPASGFKQSKFKNKLKIWKEHFSHCRINHPKSIPKSAEELNQSSLKQTKVHTDFSWLYTARPKKKKNLTGWLVLCMSVKKNLSHWRYCCHSLRSHTKPQRLFPVSHYYNMDAFTWVSHWYSNLLCFNYCTTNQLCRTVWFMYWQLLLRYLHRANLLLIAVGSFKKGWTGDYHSEIIGFFLCAQSLVRGHPHSHSWR